MSISFANVYGDNMVFQQNSPITVWGYGSGTVELVMKDAQGRPLCSGKEEAKDGRWSITLPSLPWERNLTLEARCESGKASLKNVAVGEVWLCSGQSNIECNFEYCSNTEEYVKAFGKADVRFMEMEVDISFEPRENAKKANWMVLDSENCLPLSVVSCIFGHNLAEKLDVPIGLVRNYRSGNRIYTFVSEELIRSRSEYASAVEDFEREKAELKSAWSMVPCGLYNAMTRPVEVFSFRGVLWYQGESDAAYDRPGVYGQMLSDMFSMWRKAFRNDSLKIVMIQLPPFSQPPFDYKVIRNIQLQTAKREKNVYLISTADLGPKVINTDEEGWFGIHPKYKNPVGERAALAALSQVYRKTDEEWSGPMISEIENLGDEIKLTFKNVGTGLCVDGELLKGFAVSRDACYNAPAEAEITASDTVVLKNTSGAKTVSYCFVNKGEDHTLGGTLTNNTNIPAFPFISLL